MWYSGSETGRGKGHGTGRGQVVRQVGVVQGTGRGRVCRDTLT